MTGYEPDMSDGMADGEMDIYGPLEEIIKGLRDITKERKRINNKYMYLLCDTKGQRFSQRMRIIGSQIYGAIAKIPPKDIYSEIDRSYKKDLDMSQKGLINLNRVADKKAKDLDRLAIAVDLAEKNEWTVEKLLAFLSKYDNIPIYAQTFEAIRRSEEIIAKSSKDGPEKVKKMRLDYLARFKNRLELGRNFLKMLGVTAVLGIESVKKNAMEYGTFREVVLPMRVMTEVSKTMAKAEKDSLVSTSAVYHMADLNVKEINLALDAMEYAKKEGLTSEKSVGFISRKTKELESRLKQSLGFNDENIAEAVQQKNSQAFSEQDFEREIAEAEAKARKKPVEVVLEEAKPQAQVQTQAQK